MKYFTHLVALASVAALLAACAPQSQDDSAALAEIKANTPVWFDHYNAGDADGVAALYAENAIMMPPDVAAVAGRSAIRDYIAVDIAATQSAGLTSQWNPVTDGVATGDTAWVSGTFSFSDSAGSAVATGKYATVYARVDGEWLIARDIWNMDAPAASAYSDQLAALETLIEAWNTQDVDRLDAIASAEMTRRAPDQDADSLEEIKAFIRQVHVTYPDFSIANDGAAAGPGGAYVKWTVTATNTGEGSQAPTGRPIEVTGISRYEFADGKIISEYVAFDSMQLLSQLESTAMPHAAD